MKTTLHSLNKPENLIRFGTDRPGHDLRYAIDATKIEHELGWMSQTKFDLGIQSTIQWYINNEVWWCNVLDDSYRAYHDRKYEDR